MRVLLGSGGFRTPERLEVLARQMHAFFGPLDRLLFIPYALRDHDAYVQHLHEKGLNGGYQLDGIHRHDDPREAVRRATGIYVGGGNTFRLLHELYRLDLLDTIRARVHAGVPYLGISAGANVACPTIKTTNDMPIIAPPRLEALALVPFQVNPHYYTGQTYVKVGEEYHEHYGETRDDRIREFHEMNDTPVVGLWEAGLLRIENGSVMLIATGARIFRTGQEAVDVEPGARLEAMLGQA